MSIQNENTMHAACTVASDGTLQARSGIAEVVRTGEGAYTVTLQVPLAATERVMAANCGTGEIDARGSGDTTVFIRTYAGGFIASDEAFNLEIHRLPTVN